MTRVLREMHVDRLWEEATDAERRVLVEELVETVAWIPTTRRTVNGST